MPNEQELNKVKELLASGQTEPAADLLLQLAKEAEKEHYNTALLLKNRVETLQHRVIEGVLSQSEERVEWARVSKGIVELVDQITKGEKPQREEDIVVKGALKKPAQRFQKAWLWALPLSLVAVFAIPKMFINAPDGTAKTERVAKPNLININGTLKSSNGMPVAKATIIIKPVEDGILPGNKLEVQTSPEGKYRFKLPESLIGKQVSLIIKRGDRVSKPRHIRVFKDSFNALTVEN